MYTLNAMDWITQKPLAAFKLLLRCIIAMGLTGCSFSCVRKDQLQNSNFVQKVCPQNFKGSLTDFNNFIL